MNKIEESIRRRKRLGLDEFITKYVTISSTSIDNKRSSILVDFAKKSLFLSIRANNRLIDKHCRREDNEVYCNQNTSCVPTNKEKSSNNIESKENSQSQQKRRDTENVHYIHKEENGDSKITMENELENITKETTDTDLEEIKPLIPSTHYKDVLFLLEKEKNPLIREIIIYNSKNIHQRSPNSDIYVCSIPQKCAYSGDRWFMFKHPCKGFYIQRKEKEKINPSSFGGNR